MTDDATDETEQMADVDHTPPHGEGVNRAFERGTEGKNETT
ncbi:hypothetical protein [Halorientalis litorea]|nr:hypothetical protein [Halorientalis litorea]